MLSVIRGSFSSWNTMNLRALKRIQHLLIRDNRDILNAFDSLRQGGLLDRLLIFKRCGIYRQTWQDTLFLRLAAIFRKI